MFVIPGNNAFQQIRRRYQFYFLFNVLLLLTTGVSAQFRLPDSSGFSGFIAPTIGYMQFRNNMVASFQRYDLAERQTSSIFDKPQRQNMFLVLAPIDFAYTFSKSRTQIFLGMRLEELIRFNLSQQVGIRQQSKKLGVAEASFLLSALPTMVWEDPYIENEDRIETNRNSYGLRFSWDLMFNSDFRLQYTLRRIRIDREESGAYLGLSPEEMGLLDRNGYKHMVELLYWVRLKNRQLLAPALAYINDARNGSARARNSYEFRINYNLNGKRIMITAYGFIGYSRYREVNPIYLKREEDLYAQLVASIYYINPWGWRLAKSDPISFFLSAVAYQSNTNIDFYYKEAQLLSAGVFIRWK